MHKKDFKILLALVIVLVLVFYSINFSSAQIGFSGFIEKYFSFLNKPSAETVVEEQEGVVLYDSENSYEAAIIKAVEEASPSVVSIIVSKDLPVIEQCPYDPFGDLPDEYRNFFWGGFNFTQPCQKGTEKREVGGGSGFVVSEDGLILTNKHVVSDEDAEYTVLTNDGKKYDAKVLARDSVQDLAVLKISVDSLNPLKFGDSDSLKLGQTAIAIGNALGEFRNTVSTGVISGLYRKITASDSSGNSENLDGLIQTDAAINSGNSGGPLLNLKGEVIGINTAIVSGAQNIGFAIPINKAKRAVDSVKKSGKILTPYLGVRYFVIDDQVAEKENLLVKRGALIRGSQDGPAVLVGSPAEKAGLMAEDIVLEVNGTRVDENNSLSELIQKHLVGDKISLKILRAGKEMLVSATLGERDTN